MVNVKSTQVLLVHKVVSCTIVRRTIIHGQTESSSLQCTLSLSHSLHAATTPPSNTLTKPHKIMTAHNNRPRCNPSLTQSSELRVVTFPAIHHVRCTFEARYWMLPCFCWPLEGQVWYWVVELWDGVCCCFSCGTVVGGGRAGEMPAVGRHVGTVFEFPNLWVILPLQYEARSYG